MTEKIKIEFRAASFNVGACNIMLVTAYFWHKECYGHFTLVGWWEPRLDQ